MGLDGGDPTEYAFARRRHKADLGCRSRIQTTSVKSQHGSPRSRMYAEPRVAAAAAGTQPRLRYPAGVHASDQAGQLVNHQRPRHGDIEATARPTMGISTATSSVSSESGGIPVFSLPSTTTVRPCAARRSALIWEAEETS